MMKSGISILNISSLIPIPLQLSLCLVYYSSKDVDMKERIPLKFKTQSVDLDSTPVKKARRQKSRRILEDSSDEENNGVADKHSTANQNGQVKNKEQATEGQGSDAVGVDAGVEDDNKTRTFIEVMSPQNKPTLIPKRKTGWSDS